MAEPVVIEVKADTKDAERNLKKFDKVASSAFLDVEKNAKQMQAATKAATAAVKVGAVAATAAVAALSAVTVVAVRAANEQEKAEQQLATALANSGQLTRDNFNAVKEYGQMLGETTTGSDAAIISLQALAITMGLSTDQVNVATEAAMNMAAATGMDATQAMKNMSKTLGGLVGELGEVIPELKDMTKEQLKAGAAIDLVASKFKGAAQGEAKTFGGSMAVLGSIINKVWIAVGEGITQSQVLIDVMDSVGKVLLDVADKVRDNRGAFMGFIRDGVVLAIKGFAQLVRVIGGVPLALRVVAQWLDNAQSKVYGFAGSVLEAIRETTGFGRAAEDAFKAAAEGAALSAEQAQAGIDAATAQAAAFEGVAKSLEDVANAAANADVNEIVSQDVVDRTKALNAQLQDVKKTVESGFVTSVTDPSFQTGHADDPNTVGPAAPQAEEAVAKGTEKGMVRGANAAAAAMSGSFTEALALGIEKIAGLFDDVSDDMAEDIGMAVSIGAAAFQLLASVSADELSTLMDGFADTIVAAAQNLGPVLVTIFDKLDVIIVAVVNGLIQALASLVANLPAMFVGLVKSVWGLLTDLLPEIWGSLKSTFKEAWSEFVSLFGELFSEMGNKFETWLSSVFDTEEMGRKLKAWMGEVFGGVRDWITQAFSDLGQGFRDIANFFIKGLNWVIDGLNKIPLVDINRIPEFHDGGIVGGAGESVAMLQAGEVVVNADGQARLLDAIAQGNMMGGGESGGTNITIYAPPESQGEFTQRVVKALADGRERGQVIDTRPGVR